MHLIFYGNMYMYMYMCIPCVWDSLLQCSHRLRLIVVEDDCTKSFWSQSAFHSPLVVPTYMYIRIPAHDICM